MIIINIIIVNRVSIYVWLASETASDRECLSGCCPEEEPVTGILRAATTSQVTDAGPVSIEFSYKYHQN